MALRARLSLQKFPILVIGAWPVALNCKVTVNQRSGPVTPSVCQIGCNFLWNLISPSHFTIVVFLSHWCFIPMALAILYAHYSAILCSHCNLICITTLHISFFFKECTFSTLLL